ncbi:hypothetical protein EBR78_04640 [bacterium]|nr:hypothetical protein [bacterium]NBX82560.1 hypothetical protein [bacterium]
MRNRLLLVYSLLVSVSITYGYSPKIPQRSLAAYYSSAEWLKRCSIEVNTRIAGKTAQNVMLWRDGDKYLSSSWAFGLDLTAVQSTRNAPRGVAVTPRHLLYTKHYGWHAWPGQTVRFLTIDNQVVSRVVDEVKYLGSGNNSNFEIDVAVVRLKEDLPPSIKPMKLVAPLGLQDVAQSTCPILRIDQENKALLVGVNMYSNDYSRTRFGFFQPRNETYFSSAVRSYAPFYETMVTGDSTSSSILLYKDQSGVTPFLVSQVTFGGTGSGPNLSALVGDIQATIESFGDTDSKYRLAFGPPEFTGTNPVAPLPQCTLDVVYKKRNATTGNCNFSLKITNASSLVSNPFSTPQNPRWTIARGNKAASGVLTCNGTTYPRSFSVTVKGPSGHGTCSANVR